VKTATSVFINLKENDMEAFLNNAILFLLVTFLFLVTSILATALVYGLMHLGLPKK
jgi:hypothetical protein